MRRLALAFVVFLVNIALATAEVAYQPVDINFNLARISKYLTQQTVSQSFQDSRGFLWFLTQEGLNKYNGVNLETYQYSQSNSASISSNSVTRITEDTAGNLWISTIGGGLNLYDPITNGFTAIYTSSDRSATPLSNDILTVFGDQSGNLWLGYENAFSQFDTKTGNFRHYTPDNTNTDRIGAVNSFDQSSNGTIWAGSLGGGLIEIQPGSNRVVFHQHDKSNQSSISSNNISGVVVDKNQSIWAISRDSGITVFEPSKNATRHFRHDPNNPKSISSDQIWDAFEDLEGTMWIATYEGLNLYVKDKEQFFRYTSQNTGLPSDRIFSISQSREGKYWVGTFFGLVSGTATHFRKVDAVRSQLSSNSVNTFAETSDGSIWIGTDDGLNRLRPNEGTFEWINESSYPKISSPDVMTLYAEGYSLWIGTFNGGLNQLDLNTNITKTFKNNPLDDNSIGANGVTSILRLSDNQLLIGTFGGGLSIYQEDSEMFLNFKNSPANDSTISNNNVIALFEDSFGLVWVGTENGLNRFDPIEHTFESYFYESGNINSISSDMVWAFYEDQQQSLWLGTRGGSLNRWDAEDRRNSIAKFHHFSKSISLPSSDIYGIINDDQGNLWMSHNRGITKFNPKTLESQQYGIRDGLQDTEFNMGAAFKAKTGEIYFGGNRGYNIIQPREIKDRNVEPLVSISEIKIMNQRKEFDDPYYNLQSLELDYTEKMLSIEFFAADYSDPTLLQYAYKLEGINPDWVISPDARIASFTTLPTGKYLLKLAAASPDGVWNWNGFSLPITVKPPPWLSPLAYAVYGVFFTFAIFVYFTRQKRQTVLALKRQKELEDKVQERTTDLEEARLVAETANRSKSEFLATMSHEIRTPMHGMIGMTELLLHTELNEQQKRFAEAAHNSGQSLLELINDILDFSKIEASKVELEDIEFSLVELVDEICYLQGEPAYRSGLSLLNICGKNLPDSVKGDPAKIRQVIMNLVSNSIKFTHDGVVKIETATKFIKENNNSVNVEITVSDTGIGMDEETQRRVFDAFTQADASTTREYGGTGLGLAISRQYIELMGGEINITSKSNQGTSIKVCIPLKIGEEKHQIQKKYPELTAVILSDDPGVIEMLSSHLSRLDIATQSTSQVEEFFGAQSNTCIHLVDYDYAKQQVQKVRENLKKVDITGIAIYPLTKSNSLPELDSWIHISKPITSATLKDVIAEATNFSSFVAVQNEHQGNKPSAASAKVLVAEDVETNQRIAQEMLQILGCDVDIADNGLIAFKLTQKTKYDLIFMDCQMPVMDGFESTRKIREFEKLENSKAVPIVALTAGLRKEDQAQCRDVGMNGYLTKPFTISEISKTLSLHLNKKLQPSKENQVISKPRSATRNTPSIGNIQDADIINMKAIDSIREVEAHTGKSILPSLLDGFTDQMNQKMGEISESIISQDSESIYRNAHAIKSMSANIGAEKVRLISAHIENDGKSEKIIGMEELVPILADAYSEFVNEFKSELIH